MADYSHLPLLNEIPRPDEEEEEEGQIEPTQVEPIRPMPRPPVLGTPTQTAEASAPVPTEEELSAPPPPAPADYASLPMVDKLPDPKQMTQQQMLASPEKMAAIRDYMIDRKGVQWKDRPDEELLDTWMAHMRFFNTNEVRTIGELRYTLGADENKKARAKAAYDTYDELAPFYASGGIGETAEGAWEYTKATLTSPSTYLGGIIGGKLAQKALSQGAKSIILKAAVAEAKKGGGAIAANQVIKEATKSKVATAVVGGIIADSGASSMQDYAYQLSRMEVGAQDEFDYVENAIALTGGLIGGGVAYVPQAAKGLTNLDNVGLKIGLGKKLNAEAVSNTVAKKLDTSVKKLSASIKDWSQQIADGKPVLEKPLDDVMSKVGWFFDVDDPDSIVRVLVDSGVELDFDEGARFTEQITNYARELPQKDITRYNKILKPTGVKFGQLLDYIARAESSGGTILNKAQRAQKFAKDFANMSAASRQVDENIVRETADLMDLPTSQVDKPQAVRYVQSVWRRLLVSNLSTTALNVIGWSQAYGARSLAEMVHSAGLAGAGVIGKMAGAKWGDKQLARSNALFQNQIFKLKMLLDPYSTIEGFKELTDKLPTKMQKNTIKSYFGGVDQAGAAEIYKMNPQSKVIKAVEGVADVASTISLIHAQDVFTKSFSGIAEIDKLSRLHYGRGIDDLIAKGDTRLITEDMWETSIQAMLKDTFSVDHTRGKEGINKFAGIVEQISNAPVIGFLFPFGRFMNNNLAFAYEYSPLAFLPIAAKMIKSGGKDAAKYSVQEKVSRAMVGTAALATLWSGTDEAIENGLQWYQIEDSTGSIDNKQNIAPENIYRIIGRIKGLYDKGEGIPPEMFSELLNVLGPGQWNRQLTGQNPLTELVGSLSGTSSEEQKSFLDLVNDMSKSSLTKAVAKPLAGIAAGFTRPLDVPNKILGMATGSDVAIDRRQAKSLGDTMKQELTRYTNNFFAPYFADNVATDGSPMIGTPKRAATRPEGDIRDPNPYSSLLSRKEEPPANSIDRLLGMVSLPPFIMDKRSAVPAFDHFVNEEVAPILNNRAAQALRDPVFQGMPQNEKVKYVRDMLTSVRKEVIQNLGDGGIGGLQDQLNYERSKWSGLSSAEREIAKMKMGITTPDNELSLMQIQVLREYIENEKKFRQYLIEN